MVCNEKNSSPEVVCNVTMTNWQRTSIVSVIGLFSYTRMLWDNFVWLAYYLLEQLILIMVYYIYIYIFKDIPRRYLFMRNVWGPGLCVCAWVFRSWGRWVGGCLGVLVLCHSCILILNVFYCFSQHCCHFHRCPSMILISDWSFCVFTHL